MSAAGTGMEGRCAFVAAAAIAWPTICSMTVRRAPFVQRQRACARVERSPHVCIHYADVGVFYTGRDWASRGTSYDGTTSMTRSRAAAAPGHLSGRLRQRRHGRGQHRPSLRAEACCWAAGATIRFSAMSSSTNPSASTSTAEDPGESCLTSPVRGTCWPSASRSTTSRRCGSNDTPGWRESWTSSR
jgi:hypothetical protein